MTLALGLVAASGAGLLALGPRLLGGAVFGGLALQWTVSTIFGLGVAAPAEQLLNRRLNVDPGASMRSTARGLWSVASLFMIGIAAAFGWSDAQERFRWLVPGACVAVLGWTMCALARGRLLGAGDLRAYAQSQAAEASARFLFLAVALAGQQSPWVSGMLSAAVGVPLFVGAAWALAHRHPARASTGGYALDKEFVAFVLYAMAYQVCLNGLPLLLEWRAGARQPTLTGAFVVANSYFRAATIITGGILVQALTVLSLVWGRGDRAVFRWTLRRASARSVGLALVGSLLALGAAPLVLPLLYGGTLGLPTRTYVALAVSTVLVVATAAQATGLLAAGSAWPAVAAWTSGALAMVLIAVALPVEEGVAFWAVIIAPVVTLVVALWSVRGVTGD